ncbi:MAG: hypothetical protein LBP63_09430 [Prevotellaceae bacterium]|nr:hypothetical protein [Prevotellaceae bacterium]
MKNIIIINLDWLRRTTLFAMTNKHSGSASLRASAKQFRKVNSKQITVNCQQSTDFYK